MAEILTNPTESSEDSGPLSIEIDVEKIENCYSEIDGKYKCNFCTVTYLKKGQIKNHLESKHNLKIDLGCLCGKVFSDYTKLERHRKCCKN